MRKTILFSKTIFLLTFAQVTAQKNTKENPIIKAEIIKTFNTKGEVWIKKNIEDYYNLFSDIPTTMEQSMLYEKQFFTQRYIDFRRDVIDLIQSNKGMNQEIFTSKWKDYYTTKGENIEEIFLLSGDWDKVKVSQVKFLKKTDNNLWYSFTIEEKKTKKKFHKKALLVPYENSFRIDEVRNFRNN
jgi:ribosomal 30S subunit maturation factor RimM